MTGRHVPEDYEDRSDRDLLVAAVTKLDLLLESNADHEQRLRSLERRVPTLAAAATALGSILGTAGTPLVHLLTGGH